MEILLDRRHLHAEMAPGVPPPVWEATAQALGGDQLLPVEWIEGSHFQRGASPRLLEGWAPRALGRQSHR